MTLINLYITPTRFLPRLSQKKYILIRKVYLASGHEAGGDCLAPGAHHLADRDLCVRDPGVACVAIKPDHPPGT